MLHIHHRNDSISDYTINARTLATTSDWNQRVQCEAFLYGVAKDFKDELVTHDLLTSFDTLVELPIWIDFHLSS